jgi:hypothetical protein
MADARASGIGAATRGDGEGIVQRTNGHTARYAPASKDVV